MKVLIVDDDDAIIRLFSTSLLKAGYEVASATNGKSGLEKAKSEKPSLILLDQVLPDIAGNDVLKTLKSDLETKNIPVAMFSNYTLDQQMQDAIQLGAVDYILKYQVEPQDLVEKVNRILQESNAGGGTPPPAGTPPASNPPAGPTQ